MNGMAPERKVTNGVPVWDFTDPGERAPCNCSR